MPFYFPVFNSGVIEALVINVLVCGNEELFVSWSGEKFFSNHIRQQQTLQFGQKQNPLSPALSRVGYRVSK
jgi:hypothetical protein